LEGPSRLKSTYSTRLAGLVGVCAGYPFVSHVQADLTIVSNKANMCALSKHT